MLALGIRVAFVHATSTVSLGTASSFAVLAGSGITNTGTTLITGDVGSFPTTTQTGFGPGADSVSITGTNHSGDGTTQSAKTALTDAITYASTQAQDFPIVADLGGQTLTPGVHRSGSSIGLTGTVILDGGGDINAVFIFQAPSSTLTTASSSVVSLIGGAQACNVFWQIGSSATLGDHTTFSGTILAGASITDNGSSSISGRLLASSALVTLNNTTVAISSCAAAPILHLRKDITNNNGGTAANTDWTLTATGTVASPTNLSGTTPVDSDASFKADTYTLAESGGPAGYSASAWVCVGGTQVGSTIAVSAGQEATCTITNDDIAPTLHLRKDITNNNGGTAANTDWTLSATGTLGSPTNLSGTTPVDSGASLKADTYTLAESGPSGYTASAWVCVGGTQVGSTIAVGLNQTATCTITNDDIAPALHLRKVITNNNGGTALNTDWTLTATGALGSPTNLSGTTPVDSGASLKADTYTLAESGPSGYTASAWVCVGGTQVGSTIAVELNQTATCTITNDDTAPTLRVIKTVINDNGRTAIASDATLHVMLSGVDVTGSPQTGVGSPGTLYTLNAGTYTVSESISVGYTATISGDCSASGAVTLAIGNTKTCTITNDDTPQHSPTTTGTITVNKVVVNDNGGTKTIADFPLFINGMSILSGVPYTFAAYSNQFVISETSDSAYIGTFSGDCDSVGVLYLHPGENIVCTVTNNDVAPAEVAPIMEPIADTVISETPPNIPATITEPSLPITITNPDASAAVDIAAPPVEIPTAQAVPTLPNTGFENSGLSKLLLFFMGLLGIASIFFIHKYTIR